MHMHAQVCFSTDGMRWGIVNRGTAPSWNRTASTAQRCKSQQYIISCCRDAHAYTSLTGHCCEQRDRTFMMMLPGISVSRMSIPRGSAGSEVRMVQSVNTPSSSSARTSGEPYLGASVTALGKNRCRDERIASSSTLSPPPPPSLPPPPLWILTNANANKATSTTANTTTCRKTHVQHTRHNNELNATREKHARKTSTTASTRTHSYPLTNQPTPPTTPETAKKIHITTSPQSNRRHSPNIAELQSGRVRRPKHREALEQHREVDRERRGLVVTVKLEKKMLHSANNAKTKNQ
jgi:hypothetical protein